MIEDPYADLTEAELDVVECIAASIGYGLYSHTGQVVSRRVYDTLKERGFLTDKLHPGAPIST